jgi:hypothetical protein
MNQQAKYPLMPIAWLVWISMCISQLLVYFVIGEVKGIDGIEALRFFPVLPLLMSSLLRWLVLPRITSKAKALPIFIAGAALADACGIAGSILAPELKETYLVLSFMGLAQFIPSFALRQKD